MLWYKYRNVREVYEGRFTDFTCKTKDSLNAKITCTMKNLFGAIPEKYKIKHHIRLTEAICEFASARKPDLSMVDGLIGMDGKDRLMDFQNLQIAYCWNRYGSDRLFLC